MPEAKQNAVTKVDALKNMLHAPSVQEQFQNALQDNCGPFVASIIELFSGDNYLQGCDPKQVIVEALRAAVLKLPIIKTLGFAYIVPYKNKDNVLVPQFQLGYKGLIQLALRTNQYRIINADVVYEGEYRSKNKLTGEYDLSGEPKSDTIIGYFAHFEMRNGFARTLYMTKGKVVAHAERYSKSYKMKNSPWHTEFDAMATKTVLRGLLSHWGMLSPELIKEMDEDIADRVQEEIGNKANNPGKPMGFDSVQEAEMVHENGMEGPGY